MIYVGRRYTSRVTATVAKPVACEKCGRQYSYRATRKGVGQGSSPYFLNNAGAAQRAEERARANVTKKLRSACEVVPCPSCGWVQQDMVAEARRRRHRWMIHLGVIVSILAAVVLAVSGATARYGEGNAAVTVLATLLGLSALCLIPLRVFLNSQHDPNAGHPAGAAPGAARHAPPVQPAQAVRAAFSPAPVTAAAASFPNPAYNPAYAQAAAIPLAPVPADSDWYCAPNGQQTGPLSARQLRGLITAGRLDPMDYVWRNGMPNWVPAQSVPGLFTA